MKKTLIIVFYVAMWFATWPALLADLQAKNFADETYRADLAFAIGLSLLPPTWLIAPFVTGFYEHGFQIRRRVR